MMVLSTRGVMFERLIVIVVGRKTLVLQRVFKKENLGHLDGIANKNASAIDKEASTGRGIGGKRKHRRHNTDNQYRQGIEEHERVHLSPSRLI